MTPFSPQDIGSLSKLAGILAVPFTAAALFLDRGFWFVDLDAILDASIISAYPVVVGAVESVAFLIG